MVQMNLSTVATGAGAEVGGGVGLFVGLAVVGTGVGAKVGGAVGAFVGGFVGTGVGAAVQTPLLQTPEPEPHAPPLCMVYEWLSQTR